MASLLAGLVTVVLPADAADGVADPVGAESAAALAGDIVFSEPSGLFRGRQAVELSTDLADFQGAEIRYTTDGTLPTSSSLLADGPVTLTETTRLRAQAFVDHAPVGRPGTALYLEAGFGAERDAVHDLPVVVLDDFGAGQPSRDEYADAAVLEFRPGSAGDGSTSELSGEPVIATRAGVQLHGQSSAVWYEKKSYRIELRDNEDDDADHPLAGLPAESDWVLRGPYPDKALIRDAYVYSLGAELGLQAPKFRYVELYTNLDGGPLEASDYQGLYLVVEKIKDGKNRLDLKDLDPEDITEPKVSGGYLMKFELGSAKSPTLDCPGLDETCWRDLELIEPKEPVAEQTAWITGYLQRFEDALRSADPADPQTGYPAYIDVPSFVDYVIVNELSREMDAYVRSAHFHKDRRGLLVAGPLWDYDLTFGTGKYFNNDQVAGWQYEQVRDPHANGWFLSLMSDPTFVAAVKQRWRTLRAGVLSDAALHARATGLAAPIAAAAQRNVERWPVLGRQEVGSFQTEVTETWQEQVELLRQWVVSRAAWLDSPEAWGDPATATTTTTTTTTATTTTATTTTDGGVAEAGCAAEYITLTTWPGGFQGQVTVTATDRPISAWSVKLRLPEGASAAQAWSTEWQAEQNALTADSLHWNGSVSPGESATFGFIGAVDGELSAESEAVACTGKRTSEFNDLTD